MAEGNALQLGFMAFIGLLSLYVAVMGRFGSILACVIDPTALTETGSSSFNSPLESSTTTGTNTPLLAPLTYSGGSYQVYAQSVARQYGLNPTIFVNQIQAESNFNPKAVSPSGAIGIAQFLPSTAASLGIDPWDPVASLNGAAKLDASNLKAYGGDYSKMLAAYNAGGGTVAYAVSNYGSSWLYAMPLETQRYVHQILG